MVAGWCLEHQNVAALLSMQKELHFSSASIKPRCGILKTRLCKNDLAANTDHI